MLNNTEIQIISITFGIALGYLIGSISWSILISKIFYKADIRTIGSGNAGATNFLRKFGFKIGFGIFLLDALKPIISAVILRGIQILFNQNTEMVNFGILATVIGHAWPIYHGFKGGKGASCMWGAMIIFNSYITLIIWAIGFIILIVTKYMSLSTILFGILSGILFTIVVFLDINDLKIETWFFYEGHNAENNVYIFWGIVALVIIRHYKNIKRLVKGVEKKTFIFKIKNREN